MPENTLSLKAFSAYGAKEIGQFNSSAAFAIFTPGAEDFLTSLIVYLLPCEIADPAALCAATRPTELEIPDVGSEAKATLDKTLTPRDVRKLLPAPGFFEAAIKDCVFA